MLVRYWLIFVGVRVLSELFVLNLFMNDFLYECVCVLVVGFFVLFCYIDWFLLVVLFLL